VDKCEFKKAAVNEIAKVIDLLKEAQCNIVCEECLLAEKKH
jgi:hypothetical protein